MTKRNMIRLSVLILALCAVFAVGAASLTTPHTGPLSAAAMNGLVGGNYDQCVGTFIGLGFGLLIGGAVVAATGGAAAPALVLLGAYAPLGVLAC